MALKKQKQLYELLVRFGQDSEFVGAHEIWLETVTDNGEVISAKEIPAASIDAKQIKALVGEEFAKVVNSANQSAQEAASLKQALDGEIAKIGLMQTAMEQRSQEHAVAIQALEIQLDLAKNELALAKAKLEKQAK